MYTYQSPVKLFVHNHYIVAALLSLIILGIAGAWFLVRPYYQTMIIDREQLIVAQTNTMAEQNKYLAELEKIKAKYAALDEATVNELNIALPAASAVPELMVALDALTKKVSGSLVLESFSVSEGKTAVPPEMKTLGLGAVKMSLIFVGTLDYAGWKNLVAALNNNLRIFNITSIIFSPTDNKHRVNVDAYYLAP